MPKKARDEKGLFMMGLAKWWFDHFPQFVTELVEGRGVRMHYYGAREELWLSVMLEGRTGVSVTVSPFSMFQGAGRDGDSPGVTVEVMGGHVFKGGRRFTAHGVGVAKWVFDFSNRARCDTLATELAWLAKEHFAGELMGKYIERVMKTNFPAATVTRTPKGVTMGFRATQRGYVKVCVELKKDKRVEVVFGPMRVFRPFTLDQLRRRGEKGLWLVMPDGAQFQCETFSGSLRCEFHLLSDKRELSVLVNGLAQIAEGTGYRSR